MESKKKIYEKFITDYIVDATTDEMIEFPFPWKLENNKFSFNISISINVFSSGKQIRIYAELLNYNTKHSSDELHTESTIFIKFYPKKEDNDKIRDDIIENMINFRSKYRFSKILDKFVLKDDTSLENHNFFFFKEADPFRETYCCVCSDECLTFTNCGHNLCRICFSSLEIETDYCNIWKKCPICREILKCSDNE